MRLHNRIAAKTTERRMAPLFVCISKATENAWIKGLAALMRFQAREGHCAVPSRHIEGTKRLGRWVGTQRKNATRLLPEHRKTLDAMGFIWNPIAASWEVRLAALSAFKAREGHCAVPKTHIEGTIKLGRWVHKLREHKRTVPANRIRRLDGIGFVWNAHENSWEEGFAALTKFELRNNHCRVPGHHVEGMVALGRWIKAQRQRKNAMHPGRRRRLNALGFIWDANNASWEAKCAALEKFRAREGHCCVPPNHIEAGLKLGSWVRLQRNKRNRLFGERWRRLNAIGLILAPRERSWEVKIEALKQFTACEGHCLVPKRYKENAIELGVWVANQRSKKNRLPAGRKKQLDELGFVWSVFDSYWEAGFAALSHFKAREGHCVVPRRRIEGAIKLGAWVKNQRAQIFSLSAERKRRLNSLGFVWRLYADAA